MGKNKLGKLLAFATTVTAIGGVCYIFRDKIKESEIFQTVVGKVSGWLDQDGQMDDFTFDDENDFDDITVFSNDAKNNREYTSITITSTTENDITEDNSQEDKTQEDTPQEKESLENTNNDTASPNETTEENTSALEDIVVNPSFSSVATETTAEETTEAYEYEGLSDVSEDPDTLEEQDKLDF